MKKFRWIAPIVVTFFLCACGTEDKVHNENELETPPPTITQAVEATTVPIETPTMALQSTPKPTPTIAMDRIAWTGLDCEIGKDLSRRNSNWLNFGYLTYDTEGNIYFINKKDNAIYVSDAKGKNQRLIGKNCVAEAMLQKAGDWLYYYNIQEKSIKRVNIKTEEIEDILVNGPYGQFVVENEKIFTQEESFCVVDLDSGKKTELSGAIKMGFYQRGNEFWIGIMAKNSAKGYLVKYDGKKTERISLRGDFPLLAGHYLSVIDKESQTRHIYDLETKKEIDLKVNTEKAIVSDGTDFYYWSGWRLGSDYDWIENPTDMYCTISKWDGTSAEEIIKIDGASQLYHLFLTPEMLYYQPDFWVDEKQITQLWYYDLETGETGQIY